MYFHLNKRFGRHLGSHPVSKNLSNDEMMRIIYFHNLLTIKELFRNNLSVIWVHFMLITPEWILGFCQDGPTPPSHSQKGAKVKSSRGPYD